MKNPAFVVADRLFTLHGVEEELWRLMTPRYGSFVVDEEAAGEMPRLFTLELVAPFAPLQEARVMARFDCEGYDCRYEQSDTMASISILEPQSENIRAQMQCDRHFMHACAWLSGDVRQRLYCLNNFLMMLFAFAGMTSETLLFHASVVEHAGRAYLFLGKSGTGKSTHSSLWLRYLPDCSLVNDDNPAVGIREGAVVVYGTPWSGKTPCYRNVHYPVGSFVRLHQEPENRIVRLTPAQSYAELLPSCSGLKWDRALTRAQGDTIAAVVERTSVFRLGCRPDEEAARLCHATVTLA
jgi:hypothetical protein